jgi:hypothetical protein
MRRTVRGLAALLLTLTVASLSAVAVSATAGAKAPTIIAGPGSSASCTTNATAKLSPALKNDWNASPSDSVPAVAALPQTTFASNGPVTTTAKGNGTCSGTATDGVNTAAIVGVKKITVATDPAHPGSSSEASCANLISSAAAGTAGEFNTTIEWIGSGAKIANTVVTDSLLSASLSPPGFVFSGGTITGSFAGGSVSSLSPVTAALIAEVGQAQETGAQAQAGTYASLGCEPTIKLKTNGKGVTSASLKPPKGLKSIVVTGGSLSASA